MKRHFLAGLIIILPVTITVWVISFLVHVCTKPFRSAFEALLSGIRPLQTGWWIFSQEQVLQTVTTLSILLGLILLLFLIGFVGRWLFLHIVIRGIDHMMLKVPVVNKVYKACREFTDVLFSSKSTSFSQVVWAPFPTASQRAIGLVTNELTLPGPDGKRLNFTSVLIPGTPNPTVGFLVLCPKHTVTPTTIGVDSAIKWVISCGSAETDTVMKTTSLLQQDMKRIVNYPSAPRQG
jgi:uncharacterized membrane protein